MKKYRKFNLIIILLLIVAFSNTGTFAAFNDEISNIFESYNGTNNSLAIKNGKIQLDFSSEDSSKVWRIGGTDGTVIPATGEITKLNGDKVSEIRATYGPILIKNTSDYYKINETYVEKDYKEVTSEIIYDNITYSEAILVLEKICNEFLL